MVSNRIIPIPTINRQPEEEKTFALHHFREQEKTKPSQISMKLNTTHKKPSFSFLKRQHKTNSYTSYNGRFIVSLNRAFCKAHSVRGRKLQLFYYNYFPYPTFRSHGNTNSGVAG